MSRLVVKTPPPCDWEYTFDAERFEIREGILYTYDEEDNVIWVIKDWVSFRAFRQKVETPDEFYERINQEKEDD